MSYGLTETPYLLCGDGLKKRQSRAARDHLEGFYSNSLQGWRWKQGGSRRDGKKCYGPGYPGGMDMMYERKTRIILSVSGLSDRKGCHLLWWGTLWKDRAWEKMRSSNLDMKFILLILTYIKLVIFKHSDLQIWKLYIVQLNRYPGENDGDAIGCWWERNRRETCIWESPTHIWH